MSAICAPAQPAIATRAMIADDHALIRAGLREMLDLCAPGLDIVEAASLPEAASLLAADPSIGLVLLDLNIPGARGLEALAVLRRHFPSVAVAVVSADERPGLMRQALAAGAAGYLPKSMRAEVLEGALRLVLAGGVYVPLAALDGEDDASSPAAPWSDAPWSDASAADAAVDTLPPPVDTAALGLTARQGDVLRLAATGLANRQIADRLGLAEQTVKNQMSQILHRLGLRSRAEAMALIRHRRR
ncbi:response regulator transcription factor (plasmid) [Tistrella bauzanensis]|uniref:response regulator transcription factor n=1 Tax=Tistrella TaxID=171436 RepID=UPI0031F709F6